jgi:hypothetical protein
MKYESLGELESKAAVFSWQTEPRKLTRQERIERWATLLDQHQGPLVPFVRTEFLPSEERESLRADNSPLAIAFGDRMLRDDGLAGDTLGDGMAYFELSEWRAHRLLCDCHYSGMTSKEIASRLRATARPGLIERLRTWATGRECDR